MDSKEIRTALNKLKGERIGIEKEIQAQKDILWQKKRELIKYEQAKEIIREVGMKTQQQLQFHISDITSLALEAVFPDPYQLVVEFIQRRNKTECDLYFSRNENQVDPLTASGGGAVDVAAFALRIACWSLQHPHTRNTILLDEPMKWVDETLKDKASQMIKEVGGKLGIQFIIITHEPKLAAYADRTFRVSKNKKGVSRVVVE
jgi:DNA repair exonuclease SbcCD ATPase subunit